MTIAIGINFGVYVLLAADTRSSLPNWNISDRSVPLYYEDDHVKIHKTKLGLITGAGIRRLIDLVRDRLQKEEVTKTDQIVNIIKEERHHYSSNPKEEAIHYAGLLGATNEQYIERMKQEIEHTGWILSYGTGDYGTTWDKNPKLRNPKLRLGIIHPDVGDDLVCYQENEPAVIWPSEMTKEIAKMYGDVFMMS